MTSLEDHLRAKRKIVALNLFPTASGWQASVSEDRVSWRIGIDADPVAAIQEALRGDFYSRDAVPVLSEEDMLG